MRCANAALRGVVPVVVLLVSAGCAGRIVPSPETIPGMESHRIVHAASGEFVPSDSLAAAVARADVVFLGEQHDDPVTHVLERVVLEMAGRSGRPVVLSLEMFERDVQPALDEYLAGRTSEDAFLADSRPWPRYQTDYRPLVELARANGWPVVASNVPRRLAAAVSGGGVAVLDTLSREERAHVARTIVCPRDAYYERFMKAVGAHGAGDDGVAPDSAATDATAAGWRFYEAQCVKDETMAESIVRSMQGEHALVVHVNGAFHSDHGLGTAARVIRRRPMLHALVVSFVPVADPAAADAAAVRDLGDYVVFTRSASVPRSR